MPKPKTIYGAYDDTEAHLPLFYGTKEEVAAFLHRTVSSVVCMAHYADKYGKDNICMKVGSIKEFETIEER